jgi:hypothetical protein
LGRGVARCAVEKSSIFEEERRIRLKYEKAAGAIGQCLVGIIRVVPMLQSSEIPMYALDQCIAAVVAQGKGKEVLDMDEAHVSSMLLCFSREEIEIRIAG